MTRRLAACPWLTGALVVSLAAPASASPIVSTSGDAVLASPPPSIAYNQWESSAEVRVWHERTTQLQIDTFIGFTNSGLVFGSGQQIFGNIPAGTWVSSTMIRIDPVNLESITRTGSVTFNEPIIGVDIGDGLGFRDPLYARPGIAYNTNDFRGLELFGQPTGGDSFNVAEDRLSIAFTFEIGDWTDDLRVITQAPCPADFNGDGFVDQGDITTFIALFLDSNLAADTNADGFLDTGDITTFITLFLAGC